MNTLKSKTAKGLFWGAINNGTMQLLNIIIGIVLARLLMPSDYGLIGMLTIFTTIAATLQESGFTSALTNIPEPSDKDYNAVFWFSTLMGLVLYIILCLCAPFIAHFFHQPQLLSLSRFVFTTILFSAFGTAPAAYLFKNMKIKETTILRVSSLSLSGFVGIILALKGMTYWSLAWQQFTYIALTSISRFFIISWKPSLPIDFTPIRKMFGFSSKILITNILNQVSNNILTLIFGRLFSAKIVGNFTQAYKWNTMASNTISGTLAQVTQPVFVATNNEKERQLAVLRKMMRFTAFLAFPCMLGLAIIAKEFLIILISDKWTDSVPILQILCISGAFLPLYTPLQNVIISHGRSDTFMWISLSQLSLQLILILLTAHYGILPMVTVYSFFIAAWTIIWQWRTKHVTGYSLLMFAKDILPFLLAAMVACGAAFVAGCFFPSLLVSMLVKIAVAAAIYVAVMKVAHAKIMDECIHYLMKRHA